MGAADDVRALAGRLETAETDVAELLRSLLVVSRVHDDVARSGERSDAVFEQVLTLSGAASVAVRGSPFDVLPEARAQVAASLRALAALGDPHAALGARRLAHELDATPHGELLVDRLLARGERVLADDDLVPFLSPLGRADHPLRMAYEGRLGTSPARLGLDAGALPRSARLVPRLPHGARLRFVPGYASALDELSGETRVGCAIPSGRDALTEPLLEAAPGGARFFGVALREAREQRRRARELFAKADERGCSVVVLPEVSIDETGARQLAGWVSGRSKAVRLAVCGSFHAKRRGARRNVCVVAARGLAPLEVHKIVPFVGRLYGVEAFEDIRPSEPELALLAGARATAIVLVCRDFVDRELSRAAEDLRPTLVLVPACSPRTSDFSATAAKLASGAQAHVLVSNLCDAAPGERPAVALLARPDRLEVQSTEVLRAGVDPPVLVVGALASGPLEVSN